MSVCLKNLLKIIKKRVNCLTIIVKNLCTRKCAERTSYDRTVCEYKYHRLKYSHSE